MVRKDTEPSYGRVYEEGRSVARKYLVMYYREIRYLSGWNCNIKRLGKACVRNRVKRRIRECFRHVLPLIEPRGEFVFIARQRAALCSYQELLGAATDLLKRMDLLE